MKGIYNDGHHDDHHCSIYRTPSCMVAALLSQKQSSVSPRTRGSDDNYARTRCLYGSSATDTALVNISGSFYSDCRTVRYVLIGTYKRTYR